MSISSGTTEYRDNSLRDLARLRQLDAGDPECMTPHERRERAEIVTRQRGRAATRARVRFWEGIKLAASIIGWVLVAIAVLCLAIGGLVFVVRFAWELAGGLL